MCQSVCFVSLRLTPPITGIEPGGRMRCAITSMSYHSPLLGTGPIFFISGYSTTVMHGTGKKISHHSTITEKIYFVSGYRLGNQRVGYLRAESGTAPAPRSSSVAVEDCAAAEGYVALVLCRCQELCCCVGLVGKLEQTEPTHPNLSSPTSLFCPFSCGAFFC